MPLDEASEVGKRLLVHRMVAAPIENPRLAWPVSVPALFQHTVAANLHRYDYRRRRLEIRRPC